MNEEIKPVVDKIREIKADNKREADNLKSLQMRMNLEKNVLDTIRVTDRNNKDCHMRKEIDEVLKKHGVDRGACHGGDFTGVALLILNNQLEEIFRNIEKVLLANVDSKVEPSEIREQVEGWIQLFSLMDDIFSFTQEAPG
jgi:hypothetical protein